MVGCLFVCLFDCLVVLFVCLGTLFAVVLKGRRIENPLVLGGPPILTQARVVWRKAGEVFWNGGCFNSMRYSHLDVHLGGTGENPKFHKVFHNQGTHNLCQTSSFRPCPSMDLSPYLGLKQPPNTSPGFLQTIPMSSGSRDLNSQEPEKKGFRCKVKGDIIAFTVLPGLELRKLRPGHPAIFFWVFFGGGGEALPCFEVLCFGGKDINLWVGLFLPHRRMKCPDHLGSWTCLL